MRKAPVGDGIQNILSKNLSKKALLQMINIHIFIALSYKAEKDKLFAASYRPIRLLPTLSKVFERIIYKKIKKFESINNILITNQFGFRNNRSSVQQLIRHLRHISTNFNKKISTDFVLFTSKRLLTLYGTQNIQI